MKKKVTEILLHGPAPSPGNLVQMQIPLNELESWIEPRNLFFSLQVNLCTLNFEKHFPKIQVTLIFSREENGRKKIKSLQKQLLNVKKERQAEVQVRIIWTTPKVTELITAK